MMRVAAGLLLLAALGGCAVPEGGNAPPEAVAARAFHAGGPPTITVFTMVNNRTGAGGHSSMMVSGSQRVIFDPAGSFRYPDLVERGDVIYGVTQGMLANYRSAHARDSHHVVTQSFEVSPEQAETALALVERNGAVASAFCTNATTSLLRQVPGFERVGVTFYPVRLMEQLETMPGVQTERYYENDAGDVVDSLGRLKL